jgi:putative addiction module component (TIGR02574 family)
VLLSLQRFGHKLMLWKCYSHDEILRLTPTERVALILQLWDSLEAEQLPLNAAQREDLDRRLETIDQDRRSDITGEDLKAELHQ